jgi:CubicO group peptidase (beta-lactamase class C family)
MKPKHSRERPRGQAAAAKRLLCMVLLGALATGGQGCLLFERSTTLQARRVAFSEPAQLPWMLSHMSELFPSRTISRDSASTPLPRAIRDLSTFRYDAGGIQRSLDQHLEANRARGMVILHEGRIVHEWYAENTDETTRFTSWSVAKSVTSTLVGLAVSDGAIGSLDDPIERYLPAAVGTGYEGVTVRQALQMSSGVAFTEVYSDGKADVIRYFTETMILNRKRANEEALDFPRVRPPGTRFKYNPAVSQVLGAVVHAATGRSLSALLEEWIWRPLGMEHDASWLLDREGPTGMEMSGCCLNMALRDWARFGQLFLQDGVWGGDRILPAGWVAEATRPSADHLLFPDNPESTLPEERGYQYQWWWLGDGVYSAEGVNGQLIWIDPARRVVIARAAAWPDAWDEALAGDVFRVFSALAEYLADGGGAAARPSAP